jgi:hypothetical protein
LDSINANALIEEPFGLILLTIIWLIYVLLRTSHTVSNSLSPSPETRSSKVFAEVFSANILPTLFQKKRGDRVILNRAALNLYPRTKFMGPKLINLNYFQQLTTLNE